MTGHRARCGAALGLPFTSWSLTKARDYLAAHQKITMSRETIRVVLGLADAALPGRVPRRVRAGQVRTLRVAGPSVRRAGGTGSSS